MGTVLIFSLTLYLLVLHTGSGRVMDRTTKCGQDVQQTMSRCLSPIGESSSLQSGGGFQLLSDLNTTETLCREGKLQNAMSCLEEVYNDCASESKIRNHLDLMLDVGKWRSGIERLCDKINYLREHEECSQNIAVETSHCILGENRKLQQDYSNSLVQASQRGLKGQKEIMKLVCRFANNVIWCFKDPLEKEPTCPCPYSRMFVDLVAEFMPPFCKIDTEYYYNYVYENCLESEDSVEEPQEGFSIADSSKVKVFSTAETRPGAADGGQQLSAPDSWFGNGSKLDLRIVQQPQEGKPLEGTEYRIQEMGPSQGSAGNGSLHASFAWLLLTAAACVVFKFL